MLAVKGIYKEGNIELLEPIEGIEEAELYIVVVPKSIASIEKADNTYAKELYESETFSIMKLQEKSGFAQSVLADESEDVWNEP